MSCIWKDVCSTQECWDCDNYDGGKYEDNALGEYYESLTEFVEEYNEMVEEYSGEDW